METKFVNKKEAFSSFNRSNLVNMTLRLIYQKNEGDLEKSTKEAKPFFEEFDAHIKNVYELISHEIPLWHYYELSQEDADDNFGITKEEIAASIEICKKACVEYYS